MTAVEGTEERPVRYTPKFHTRGVNGFYLTVVFCRTLIGDTIFFYVCSWQLFKDKYWTLWGEEKNNRLPDSLKNSLVLSKERSENPGWSIPCRKCHHNTSRWKRKKAPLNISIRESRWTESFSLKHCQIFDINFNLQQQASRHQLEQKFSFRKIIQEGVRLMFFS